MAELGESAESQTSRAGQLPAMATNSPPHARGSSAGLLEGRDGQQRPRQPECIYIYIYIA